MKNFFNSAGLLLSIGIVFFFLTSCSQFDEPIDTTSNDTDDLRIALTNLKNHSTNRTYYYNCSTDLNELRFAGPITSGIIQLEIVDENGDTILNQSYTNISTDRPVFNSPAGNWTVKLKLTNVSGTLTVRLGKKV